MRTVIARYSVSLSNPDSADENSEFVIMEIPQPFENHNGGQISFGSDGYLYISLGDGGSFDGDPFGNGQNLQSLLGSLLRIDIDTLTESTNYGIPPDNPFFENNSGYKQEIFAYGLRNPWRFSFDPITGWLWAADVGQDDREEIDLIYSGRNYGWNIMEGSICFDPPFGCDTTGLELPIWDYDHDPGHSVTGGFVYHGSNAPDLEGHYIYGDFESGQIWSLFYDGVNPTVNTELMDTEFFISSFGIDENDELYMSTLFDGNIYWFSGSGPKFWNWDINVAPGYGLPERDSVIITASPIEPSIFSLLAELEGPNQELIDTVQLFDDGNHYDGDTGDSLFGNVWVIPSVEESIINVNIRATFIDTDTITFEIDDVARFATIGPILYSGQDSIFLNRSSNAYFFTVSLANNGLVTTASAIMANISTSDTCVTSFKTAAVFYGDIQAGEIVTPSGNVNLFNIEINPNCSWTEVVLILFDMEISSEGDTFWSDNFDLVIPSIIGVEVEFTGLPTEYSLSNAYPNPFNPRTTIEYSLPQSGDVSLIAYNLLGEEVARLVHGILDAGYHEVTWDVSNIASGVYLYRLESGNFVRTRKMVLLK